ncbi:unnamed protein product [marine sediment metagenome]|uniref:Uncharacterized protein n=1 Tax=marine sediment metagenome TaxID=412755 RepID=X1BI94_9ZZZZ
MRVTVDKDPTSELRILMSYYNTRWISQTRFEACQSVGGEGHHFIAYGLPITQEQAIELRRWLEDDPVRIKFDEDPKGKPMQVLYTKREEARIFPLDERDFLMKPWWSMNPKRN